jgi:uncharacterized protein (DUF779 family)
VCGGPKEDHGILNGYHDKHDYDPAFKVGDRIVFMDITTERPGIIRGFQWADWSEEPLLMVDIDPPLRGATGVSNGRRIERHRVVRRGRI